MIVDPEHPGRAPRLCDFESGSKAHYRQFSFRTVEGNRFTTLTFTGVRPSLLEDPLYFTPTDDEIWQWIIQLGYQAASLIERSETCPSKIPHRHFVHDSARGAQIHLTAAVMTTPPAASIHPPSNTEIAACIQTLCKCRR
jgi:hypothetical protein